jgi:dTDP-4-dehydrorhamnose 3,5-epimerase
VVVTTYQLIKHFLSVTNKSINQSGILFKRQNSFFHILHLFFENIFLQPKPTVYPQMEFKTEQTSIRDLIIIVPEIFQDDRGFFMETYRKDKFSEFGLNLEFVQDNHSRSAKNVVRGLHFQWEPPMGKLMRVAQGSAFLVAVDIRIGSPTFGKYTGVEASVENRKQVYAPAGFARGFCVLSDYAEIQYKCTGIYSNKAESGILWNDPDIRIEWPVKTPILSKKDETAQTLGQWLHKEESKKFTY